MTGGAKEPDRSDFRIENIRDSVIQVVGGDKTEVAARGGEQRESRDSVRESASATESLTTLVMNIAFPFILVLKSLKGGPLRPAEYANAVFDSIWLLGYVVLAIVRAFGPRDIGFPKPIHFAIVLVFMGCCFAWSTWTERQMVHIQGLCRICSRSLNKGTTHICQTCNQPVCPKCFNPATRQCKECSS